MTNFWTYKFGERGSASQALPQDRQRVNLGDTLGTNYGYSILQKLEILIINQLK